jgi:hypothetical protein
MDGKIVLEEHWAIHKTLQIAGQPVGAGAFWDETRRLLVDFRDRRLADMDANGIELPKSVRNRRTIHGQGGESFAVNGVRTDPLISNHWADRPDPVENVHSLKQFKRRNSKCPGDPADIVYSHVSLTSFHRAHIRPVNSYSIRKGLLRPAMLYAKAPDVCRECLSAVLRLPCWRSEFTWSWPLRFTLLKELLDSLRLNTMRSS